MTFDSMNSAYPVLIQQAVSRGRKHAPRNLSCLELRPGNFEVLDSRKGLYSGISRRLNYRFWVVETLSYIAGFGDLPWHAELMVDSNSQMARFVNPETKVFDGAYGPRLRQSLLQIQELLRRDPETRQAYASIWSPGLPEASLDVPCTLGLHFYKKTMRLWHVSGNQFQDTLAMSALMRSNDLNWGTPYDVGAFCAIQVIMAQCVGMEPGPYYHHAGSLHVYTDSIPVIKSGDAETFLQIRIPRLNYAFKLDDLEQPEFLQIYEQATEFLTELYHWRCELFRPWTEFESQLEKQTHPMYADYWAQWAGLLRFSWKSIE